MRAFFEKKVKGLVKDDFAVGPISLDEDRQSSFIAGEDEQQIEDLAVCKDIHAQTSIQSIADDDDDDEVSITRPSNVYVLNVAFFTFLGFMAFQAFFAILANSQSMLADSEAMSVDALTYLFNMCAERIKNQPFTEYELSLESHVRLRRRTMKRLYLELVPPFISVTTLIIVTFFVMKDSLDTLFGPDRSENEGVDVDISVMLLFSGLNLALDVVNVTCFARAHQAFGIQSMETPSKTSHAHDFVKMTSAGAEVMCQESLVSETTPLVVVVDKAADALERDSPYGSNLNMCSAWTHVCADTMRSIAVLLAAGIAAVFPGVDNEIADASAAFVVSLIIISSLFPLLYGLSLTAKEIILLSRIPIS